jgi:hemerythrin superfamily protein
MDLESAISGNATDGDRATDLLRADHEHVDGLFEQYRDAMDASAENRGPLAQEICMQLEMHADIEEEIFYPAVRQEADDLVEESLQEHADVRECIDVLRELRPEDAEFDATMLRMMQLVESHVATEEDELFPPLEERMPTTLQRLATDILQRKEELAGSVEDVASRS